MEVSRFSFGSTTSSHLPVVSSRDILTAQQLLNGLLGQKALPEDGVLSKEVEGHLKELQRDCGLPETGLPDPATINALRSQAVQKTDAAASRSSAPAGQNETRSKLAELSLSDQAKRTWFASAAIRDNTIAGVNVLNPSQVQPLGISPAGIARSVCSIHSPTEAAAKLAQVLQGATESDRGAILKSVLQTPNTHTIDILSAASPKEGNLPAKDARLIAGALGKAYESGTISKTDLKAILNPAIYGPFNDPARIADLFRAGGSDKLRTDASLAMVSVAEKRLHEIPAQSMAFYAAAGSLASESATSTKAFLESVKDLEAYIRQYGPEPVLAKMMERAAKIQPPTTETHYLFCQLAHRATSSDLQAAVGEYFRVNREDVLDRFTKSLPADLKAQQDWAAFSANVLFGDEFSGQKGVRDAMGEELAKHVNELRTAPHPANVDQLAALDAKAQQVGFIIGGLEAGFAQAVQNVKDTNESRHGYIDLIFAVAERTGVGKGVNLTIEGIGSVNAEVKSGIKQGLYALVDKNTPSAKDLVVPLYQLALQVPADQWDELESIRRAVKDNVGQGYGE